MIKKVYNLILLDESGSMAALQKTAIDSFNELVQFVAGEARNNPAREQWISFFSFNGNGIREQLPLQKIATTPTLNENTYRPDSLTPLFDAIGHATGKLRYALEGEYDYILLVTILTDGAENASKEFTGTTINKIIKELQGKNWVFTYIGTNQDVTRKANRIHIKNSLHFNNDQKSLNHAMRVEKASRQCFYAKLSNLNSPIDPQQLNEGFFNEDPKQENEK